MYHIGSLSRTHGPTEHVFLELLVDHRLSALSTPDLHNFLHGSHICRHGQDLALKLVGFGKEWLKIFASLLDINESDFRLGSNNVGHIDLTPLMSVTWCRSKRGILGHNKDLLTNQLINKEFIYSVIDLQ
jgi:hypothetical protein